MKSRLSLEINPTANCSKLRIQDTSYYNPDIVVSCEQLFVTPPGFNNPTSIEPVTKEFNKAFTAIDLNMQVEGTEPTELPDGLYYIKYSINPNEKVFVEYNYLRDCKVRKKYYEKLCALELIGCDTELEKKDKQGYVKKLQEIDFYLTAAKAYVEECNVPKRGMDLFKYGSSLLDKIDLKCNYC
jgi:hypothetical protein